MKNYILPILILFSVGCRKNHCVPIIDVNGEYCCEKCFRNVEEEMEFTAENAGKKCNELCN